MSVTKTKASPKKATAKTILEQEKMHYHELYLSEGKVWIQHSVLSGEALSAAREMKDTSTTFKSLGDVLEELLRNPAEADRMIREALMTRRKKRHMRRDREDVPVDEPAVEPDNPKPTKKRHYTVPW